VDGRAYLHPSAPLLYSHVDEDAGEGPVTPPVLHRALATTRGVLRDAGLRTSLPKVGFQPDMEHRLLHFPTLYLGSRLRGKFCSREAKVKAAEATQPQRLNRCHESKNHLNSSKGIRIVGISNGKICRLVFGGKSSSESPISTISSLEISSLPQPGHVLTSIPLEY